MLVLMSIQILAKATEYIHHLEKRNKRYESENKEQKARLNAFETLFRSGSMGFNPQPMPSYQFNPDYSTPGPSPTAEVQGMIPVPENMQRLHRELQIVKSLHVSSLTIIQVKCLKDNPSLYHNKTTILDSKSIRMVGTIITCRS